MVGAGRESLSSKRRRQRYGILNGTCNYRLTKMTYEGKPFDEVLAAAQAEGYAETPPDLDINGDDTAHKCQILASLAYATRVDYRALPVEGITQITALDVQYAREMGYVIKLLARADADGETLAARVCPTLVPEDHLLAATTCATPCSTIQACWAASAPRWENTGSTSPRSCSARKARMCPRILLS